MIPYNGGDCISNAPPMNTLSGYSGSPTLEISDEAIAAALPYLLGYSPEWGAPKEQIRLLLQAAWAAQAEWQREVSGDDHPYTGPHPDQVAPLVAFATSVSSYFSRSALSGLHGVLDARAAMKSPVFVVLLPHRPWVAWFRSPFTFVGELNKRDSAALRLGSPIRTKDRSKCSSFVLTILSPKSISYCAGLRS